MDFYEAYHFLQDHPIFHGGFDRALQVNVVKADPETMRCEAAPCRQPAPQVRLTCGPYVGRSALDPAWSRDPRLDCWGDTFEEAILRLAQRVHTCYGDGSLPEATGEEEQVKRIARMEQAMHQALDGVYGLQTALERYTAAQSALRVLEDYYGSPLWMEDFEADEEGRLPDGLLRGVLSEDGVADLLDDDRALRRRLRDLAAPLS